MIDQNTFEAMAKANRFAVHNGIVIRQLEMGKAEAVLEMGPNCLNPYGRLHGGALYSLADCAGGTACRTDGRHYVTLDGSLHRPGHRDPPGPHHRRGGRAHHRPGRYPAGRRDLLLLLCG